MLAGKGSIDFKDAMGFGDNFLPVVMAANPWALAESDARLLGDAGGAGGLSIGRLPIINDAEGIAYVDKLIAHAGQLGNEAAYRAVLAADNPDKAGDFHRGADTLAEQLYGLGTDAVTKLYHPSQAVRTNLIASNTWETGLVTYSGHGSPAQIGNYRERFLTAADAAGLSNTHYPVFAALTCAAGSDAQPGTRSLAVTLVLNAQGGAIGALAPSGLSLDAQAHIMGEAFGERLYGDGASVGDALAEAKLDTAGAIDDFMAPIYSVIGDPMTAAR